MKTLIKKYKDGMQEVEIYLNSKEDKSLIELLIELSDIRLGGDIKNGWRIQTNYSIMKLGKNFVLDTLVENKHKYFNFFVEDRDLAIVNQTNQ